MIRLFDLFISQLTLYSLYNEALLLLSFTEDMPAPKSRKKKAKRDVESVDEPDGEFR